MKRRARIADATCRRARSLDAWKLLAATQRGLRRMQPPLSRSLSGARSFSTPFWCQFVRVDPAAQVRGDLAPPCLASGARAGPCEATACAVGPLAGRPPTDRTSDREPPRRFRAPEFPAPAGPGPGP